MGMLDYVIGHRGTRRRVLAGDIPAWLQRSKRKAYILAVIRSAPPWVLDAELKLIQLRARQTTELSGVEHHISHVIPLNHPRVCGLTVPWNLDIKPAKVNLAESNNIHLDEQLALFD